MTWQHLLILSDILVRLNAFPRPELRLLGRRIRRHVDRLPSCPTVLADSDERRLIRTWQARSRTCFTSR